MTTQHRLELLYKNSKSFDNFIWSENFTVKNSIVNWIENCKNNKSSINNILLFSNKVCGKTHLLKASILKALSLKQKPIFVDLIKFNCNKTINLSDAVSSDKNFVFLDNLEAIENNLEFQIDTFKLLKKCSNNFIKIMISSKKPIHKLNLELLDLITRLQQFLIIKIHPLDNNNVIELIREETKKFGVSLDKYTIKQAIQEYEGNIDKIISLANLFCTSTKKRINKENFINAIYSHK